MGKDQSTPDWVHGLEAGDLVYEACVTIIAASRRVDRSTVEKGEVEQFWMSVQEHQWELGI